MTYISLNTKEMNTFMTCSLLQLGCAAGVNLSGGRTTSELAKQIKGSQSSLDQLEQESKVRVSNVKKKLCCLKFREFTKFFKLWFKSCRLILCSVFAS